MLFKCSKFGYLISLNQTPLQLDRKGIEREDGDRAGGGGGDYSRESINQGTAIIRRNTVFIFINIFITTGEFHTAKSVSMFMNIYK